MDGGDESVFELEMGDGTSAPGTGRDPESVRRKLMRLCEPKDAPAAKVSRDVGDFMRTNPGASVQDVAAHLSSAGHAVTIRRTGGGHSGTLHASQAFENLRHSYMLVHSPPAGSLIVEPAFRDQFAITNPTVQYERLLEVVPEWFVGWEDDLMAALELVCAEMRVAFRATDRPVPPWRRKKSMESKWQPKVYRTEAVNSLDASSGGADTEAPRPSDCNRVDGEFAFLFSSLKVDPVAEFRIEDALPRIIVVGPK
ncbi:unnamed protein product [Ostreobium quekettii]|uniref:Uncharacterized protein n=1 Tax=Ostreobium quekettii TaxID=121088 RepID=A0A8S1IYM5_9CHLO|nr:unnamed protein product [Ostreobium quekettii]|eukprot:evm.model.scf_106.7 EVM.evm.TU.scf_106.7   scf_106:132125-134581(+)